MVNRKCGSVCLGAVARLLRRALRSRFSLKGCQIVAGGRSVAQTTGNEHLNGPHPGGVPPFLTPFSGCGIVFGLPGGLRYAATTGYYLTALQARTELASRP